LISNQIKNAYIEYSKEVNVHRAMPLVYDGLKTVQRRLLINGARICSNSLVKSASLIGETMANNHPHSDLSLYGTLVNLVGDYNSMFTGQGNWGGYQVPPAASRYTAVKLSEFSTDYYLPYIKYAEQVENELGHMENTYIPTTVPYALVNGTSGIGVGVGTLIPAFTLDSVIEYAKWMLSPKNKNKPDLIINWPEYSMDDSILATGYGNIKYHIIYEAKDKSKDTFIIKGGLPYTDLEEVLFKTFDSEITSNKVYIRNESGKEGIKFIIGKVKWINSELIENKIKKLHKVVNINMNWSMGENKLPVVRRLNPHDVLEMALEYYVKSVDRWKENNVEKINLEIMFQTLKNKISYLLSDNKNWREIQEELNLSEEEINYVKTKSINQLYVENDLLPKLQRSLIKIQKTKYFV
jgi:DNA gyrase subunit A